jgi:hypothetical protein
MDLYRRRTDPELALDVLFALAMTILGVMATGVIYGFAGMAIEYLYHSPFDPSAWSDSLFFIVMMWFPAVPTILVLWPLYLIASWDREPAYAFLFAFGPSLLIAAWFGWWSPGCALLGLYAIVPFAFLACHHFAPRLPRRGGYCPQCDYDLRGLLTAGCPECGWLRIPGATAVALTERPTDTAMPRVESRSAAIREVFIALRQTAIGVLVTGFSGALALGIMVVAVSLRKGHPPLADVLRTQLALYGAVLIIAVPTIIAIWPLFTLASWNRRRVRALLVTFAPSTVIGVTVIWYDPFLAVLFLYGVVPFSLLACWLLVPRRPVTGHCPTCNYNLRGELDAGCPECGWNREGRRVAHFGSTSGGWAGSGSANQ